MYAQKVRVPAAVAPFLLRKCESQPGKKGWSLAILSAGMPAGAGTRGFCARRVRAQSIRATSTTCTLLKTRKEETTQMHENRPTSGHTPAEFRRNARERRGRPASGRGTCAYRAGSASFLRQAQGHQTQTQPLTSAIVAIGRIPTAFCQLSADNGKPPRRPSGIPCGHYD